MAVYRRIVAGADGSTHGEHALRHAVALAKALGAALVEEAASWHVDLIVLGAGGVERLLLGSMADGVARRSSVPVLLVH
jgi:nucleotide-binding universal stress UspA family protein